MDPPLKKTASLKPGEIQNSIFLPTEQTRSPRAMTAPTVSEPGLVDPVGMHRRLLSYVSEPPSTLHALRAMAEQEAAAIGIAATERRASDARLGTAQLPPSEYDMNAATTARTREAAWLYGHSPAAAEPGRLPGHSMLAGDLAMPSRGMRWRGVPLADVAPRTCSPISQRQQQSPSSRKMPGSVAAVQRRRLEKTLIVDPNSSDDDDEVFKTRARYNAQQQQQQQQAHAAAARAAEQRDLNSTKQSPSKRGAGGGPMEEGARAQEGSMGEPCGGETGSLLDFEVDVSKRPFYRRRIFWELFISAMVLISFTAAGAALLVFAPADLVTNVQSWRLCFFIAGLPIIWWTGEIVSLVIVWAVERSMFTVRNALYFAYAVRKPLRNVVRAALVLGWWALIMTVSTQSQAAKVTEAYNIILRIWACVTLFMTANLLKRLLAKMIGAKFNKSSHFGKIYEALEKERLLHILLQSSKPCDDPEVGLEGGQTSSGGSSLRKKSSVRRFLSSMRLIRPRSEGSLNLDDSPHVPKPLERKSAFQFWRRTSEPLPSIGEELDVASQHDDDMPGDTSRSGRPTRRVDRSPSFRSDLLAGQTTPRYFEIHGQAPPSISPTKETRGIAEFDRSTKTPLPQVRVPANASTPPRSPGPGPGPTSPSVHGTAAGTPLRRVSATSKAPSISIAPHLPSLDEPLRKDQVMTKLAKLERYVRKNELQVTFRDTLNQTKRSEVTSEAQAKTVGNYLYWNVKQGFQPQGIHLSDLEDFLPLAQAQAAFEMLDVDGDGAASVDDCIQAMLTIYRERRNLAMSLEDARSCTAVLETLIGVILHVIFVFLYLLIFQLDIGQLWVSFSGVVLAFSFIFGNSIRTMYENVVFLFAIHPYDIGDVLYIDADYYTVDEISITFTVCLSSSNQRVWVPNQRLLTSTFVNLTTSGNRWESIKVLVDLDTPPETLDILAAALDELQASQPLEFVSFSVNFRDAAASLKMTLFVGFTLAHNGTDLVRTAKARSKIYTVVARVLTQLGVLYTLPPTKDSQSLNPQAQVSAAGTEVTGLQVIAA